MDVGGTIGKGFGVLLAPLAALGSFLRGARLVHAQGVVYRAEVHADAAEGVLGALAQRCAGPAIVRLSEAGGALGAAVRFRTAPVAVPAAGARVQDVILISVPHLWQIPIASRLTDARDFLANTYYTIAQSRVAGLGDVELRLVPQQSIVESADHDPGASTDVATERSRRLDREIATGTAVLQLEMRRVATGADWRPLVSITLSGRADLDAEALEFNPYHAGLGIEPTGFVQGLRWAVYPASELGRESRERLGAWWSRKG